MGEEGICSSCLHEHGACFDVNAYAKNGKIIECRKYKPKSQNKTCPTCMHGRPSHEAFVAFDGVPYRCAAPGKTTMAHSEHCVTCDGWEDKDSVGTNITRLEAILSTAVTVKAREGGGAFWFGCMDNFQFSFKWVEIPKYLYEALIRFEEEGE